MIRASSRRRLWTTSVVAALLLLVQGGCSSDGDAYNLVNRLRVLAIQSEPPALEYGQTASLNSLVFESGTSEPAEYRWSWCPFPTGRATGYDCAIEEQELRSTLDQYAPGASALLPSFDLGSEKSAEFSYTIPKEVLEAVCRAILEVELPAFVEVPSCETEIGVVIKLTVTQGDERTEAIKTVPLLLGDTTQREINSNPLPGALFATLADSNEAEKKQIAPDGSTQLQRGREYKLEVEVSDEQAEPYVDSGSDEGFPSESRTETLFITWYVTAGETEFSRTSYIDDKIPLSSLRENTFRAPSEVDYEGQTAEIFIVLQDNRGGVGWIERIVEFTE